MHWDRHSWWIKPLGWLVGLGKGIYWLFVHWSWVVAVIGAGLAIFGHLNDPRITDALVAGLLAFTCILILTRGLPRPVPRPVAPVATVQPPVKAAPLPAPVKVSRKGDLSAWELVDEFSLHEAALLWAGYDPAVTGYLVSDARPVLTGLKQAIIAGRLELEGMEADRVREFFGSFSEIPDDGRVTREALRNYAEGKKKYPDFLFPEIPF
jgi:hypothetical protein